MSSNAWQSPATCVGPELAFAAAASTHRAPRVSGNQDLSKQNGVKALKTPTLVVTDCSEASGEVLYLGLPVFSS